MDGQRFDNLSRKLASGVSRRAALKTVLGSTAAGLLAVGARDRAAAVLCRQPGVLCAKDAHCCSGICDPDTNRCACPEGGTLCGRQCVDTSTDPANCGGCGAVCPGIPNGQGTCAGGDCGVTCNDDFARCDDTCFAIVGFPDTPVGHQLAWVFEQLDGGATTLTEDDIAAHFISAFDPTDMIQFLQNQVQFAPFQLVGFETPPTETDGVAFAITSNPVAKIEVVTQSSDPYLITGLAIGYQSACPSV